MSDNGGIGTRVRVARERLGWTREALAYHAGVSWSAISQVESGRRTNVRPSTLAALSRALRVSIDYLVCGSPSPPTMLEHSWFPYRSDDQFLAAIGTFLADGLRRSEALIVVTGSANIDLLREHLGGDARAVEFIDSRALLSTPVAALEAYVALVQAKLGQGVPWVRVVGEPLWPCRSGAERGAWTRYESLFNLVFSGYPLTICCPYDERSVGSEVMRQARLTHPYTMGDDGIAPSPDYTDPGRFTLQLLQP